MLIGLFTIFSFMAIIDLPIIWQKDDKKRILIIYTFLMLIGIVLNILQLTENMPTSPSIIIEKIIRYFIGG